MSEEQTPRFFLIAISVFDAGEMGLHHQFDLKGSTVGRLAEVCVYVCVFMCI